MSVGVNWIILKSMGWRQASFHCLNTYRKLLVIYRQFPDTEDLVLSKNILNILIQEEISLHVFYSIKILYWHLKTMNCKSSNGLYLEWYFKTYMKVKVSQSCLPLCDLIDYTLHGILYTRILEWVAFPFSRESAQPRDQNQVFCIAGGFFTSWATTEAQE